MPTTDQLQKLQGLQQQMIPIEAIAEEIGVSSSTIYRWLKTLPKFERRAPRSIIDQLSFHQDYINLRMDEGETQPKTLLKEIKDRGYVGSKRTLTNYMVKRKRAIRSHQQNQPPVVTAPDTHPEPATEPETPPPAREINARLATLTQIVTPHDTVEPTLLSALCQDDTGLLCPNGDDRTVRVKMTQAGIVYAERNEQITPQAQVLVMARLDTAKFNRDHAAELMTHQAPTTITALMSDIDSLTDLLEAVQQGPQASLAEPTAAAEPAPEMAPEPAPAPETARELTQEEETEPNPEAATKAPSHTGRSRRSRTLPSRDIAQISGAVTGTENMQVEETIEYPQLPSAAQGRTEPLSLERQPQGPPSQDHTWIIAKAWNAVPEETHLSPEAMGAAVFQVAQEIAQAAGHPLQKNDAEILAATDIGKGFTIVPANFDGGVVISRTTPEGTRTGYLAVISNPQEGLGVRDPEFPTHIRWWNPADGPKEPWLENTLRENAARFISECH